MPTKPQSSAKERSVNGLYLGCIADDFTGASDLASFLVASGMKTLQTSGIPDSNTPNLDQYDAIVIALKSRTEAVGTAVADSLASLKWLRELDCDKFYFKYCSTFDSTDKGNIGPVIDALCEELDIQSTIVCPALPVNGRTVYQGHLFVGQQLLHESPLKDHPLTPMRDSNLLRLIEAQGKGKATSIPLSVVQQDTDTLKKALNAASEHHAYLVVDGVCSNDLSNITQASAHFPLITGGSGLAWNLSETFIKHGLVKKDPEHALEKLHSPCLVISGSCSAATRKQVEIYQNNNCSLYVNPLRIAKGEQSINSILSWLAQQDAHQAPMIYATAEPEFVSRVHAELGREQAQELIEHTLSEVCKRSTELGFKSFVIAGGETSGAVVNALEIKLLEIGKSIAPGVPMVQTLPSHPQGKINLALKSGNFGDQHFFHTAVEALTC